MCLEFSKKIEVLRRLVLLGLILENEYILAKNKIMSSYHILKSDYFKTGAGNTVFFLGFGFLHTTSINHPFITSECHYKHSKE